MQKKKQVKSKDDVKPKKIIVPNPEELNVSEDIQNIPQQSMSVLMQAIDKLARKQEATMNKVTQAHELLKVINTPIQLLSEQQMNSRVYPLLRTAKLIPGSSNSNNDNVFVTVNSGKRIEEWLISSCAELAQHLGSITITGVEDAIRKSLGNQAFVTMDGCMPAIYTDVAPWFTSAWITKPIKTSVSNNNSITSLQPTILSGEVSVLGDIYSIVNCLHRAMRLPLLLKRYTSRMHRVMLKNNSVEQSLQGLEQATVFVVVGQMDTYGEQEQGSTSQLPIIPSLFVNRILSSKELAQLEEHVLSTFDGTISMPDDAQIVQLASSDPFKDPLGAWRLFEHVTYNDKTFAKLKMNTLIHAQVSLLVMLRLLAVHKCNLFIGAIKH